MERSSRHVPLKISAPNRSLNSGSAIRRIQKAKTHRRRHGFCEEKFLQCPQHYLYQWCLALSCRMDRTEKCANPLLDPAGFQNRLWNYGKGHSRAPLLSVYEKSTNTFQTYDIATFQIVQYKVLVKKSTFMMSISIISVHIISVNEREAWINCRNTGSRMSAINDRYNNQTMRDNPQLQLSTTGQQGMETRI